MTEALETATDRDAAYADVRARVDSLLEGETDWVAAMATVAGELHHAFGHYDWTGFYRRTGPEMLTVGPYQGGHGCLRIPFARRRRRARDPTRARCRGIPRPHRMLVLDALRDRRPRAHA